MVNDNKKIKSSVGWRLIALLMFALLGLIVTTVLAFCLTHLSKFHVTMLTLFFQDVFVFILPAVLVMMIFYKKPWQQMGIDRAPSWSGVVLALVVCVVSMPALNWLVDWNENLHLPQSMAALEQQMRDAEEAAQQLTKMLLSETTLLPMLCVLFIVGIMAGVSEEFFFRGCALRMTGSNGNSHMAIWAVAIAFSAFHMQFLGFFPRMLLGAWLGYLLMWTRSLWVPVIAHALNNSVVVISSYLVNIGVLQEKQIESIGLAQDGGVPVLAIASAVATAGVIAFYIKKVRNLEPDCKQ